MLTGIISRGIHKAVQRRLWRCRRMDVPSSVGFCPGRTGVFHAHCLELKRWLSGTARVYLAKRIRRIRECGVAAGVGRRSGRVRRWSELRQPIKLLVRNAVSCPVAAYRPKIAVKRAVLLRKEDNVIDALQARAESGRNCGRCRNRARGGGSGARSAPANESESRRGGGCQSHLRNV